MLHELSFCLLSLFAVDSFARFLDPPSVSQSRGLVCVVATAADGDAGEEKRVTGETDVRTEVSEEPVIRQRERN